MNLTREEVRMCYDFAVQAVDGNYQQGNHFGVGNALRVNNESIADKILGKMGEYIFKKTLEKMYNNVQVNLNFNHLEGHDNLDDGDAEIFVDGVLQEAQYKIDVKSSSFKAQWLLVENSKFEENTIYAFVKFTGNVPENKKLRQDPESILDIEVSGEVFGWATSDDFRSLVNGEICFVYRQGDSPYRNVYIPDNFRDFTPEQILDHIQENYQNDRSNSNLHLGISLDALVNYGLPIKALRDNTNLLATTLGVEE